MSNSTASSSKNTLDSGNNILQGLRLAVGLGGEAGQNAQMGKLGLQGRLTGLQTLLEFVTAALNHTSEDVFAHWMGDQRQNSPKGKGKGKEIVVSPEVISPFGWVVGNSEWGLERDCWEISRLGMGDINDGDSTISTLTVSLCPLSVSSGLIGRNCIFNYHPFCSPHFSKLLLQLSRLRRPQLPLSRRRLHYA